MISLEGLKEVQNVIASPDSIVPSIPSPIPPVSIPEGSILVQIPRFISAFFKTLIQVIARLLEKFRELGEMMVKSIEVKILLNALILLPFSINNLFVWGAVTAH